MVKEQNPKRRVESKDKVYHPRLKLITDNFLGGIAWSLGVFIGTTIVISLLGVILSKINFLPVIGSFINQVIEVTNQYRVE